jgi:hypothetical protein
VGTTVVGPKVRMVTHVDIDDDAVGFALDAWASVLG